MISVNVIIRVYVLIFFLLVTNGLPEQNKEGLSEQCQQIEMYEAIGIFDGRKEIKFTANDSICYQQNATRLGKSFYYIRCGPNEESSGKQFPIFKQNGSTTTHLAFTNYHVNILYQHMLRFENLLYLDLVNNDIYILDRWAFAHLTRLEVLDLGNNRLHTFDPETAYPHQVFEPFSHSLRVLNLDQGRQEGPIYWIPDAEIGSLEKLEDLIIDIVTGGNETIGPGFENLKSLRRLQLKLQNGVDYKFEPDFFYHLKNVSLKCLYMSSMDGLVEGVYKIFNNLNHLEYLDLQYSYLLFTRDELEEFWVGLKNTKINFVDLTTTGLNKFYFQPDLDSLTTILVGNNYLELVLMEPPLSSLRHLVMKFNQMSALTFYNTLWYLMSHRNLEHIEINYQTSSPFGVSASDSMEVSYVAYSCSEYDKREYIYCFCENYRSVKLQYTTVALTFPKI